MPPAGHDGENLQADDHVDDAVAGAESLLRFLEPRCEDAVFDHAAEHAVGADDRGVHRPGQDESAHDDYEALKKQPQRIGADHVHGQAANQVGDSNRAAPCRG